MSVLRPLLLPFRCSRKVFVPCGLSLLIALRLHEETRHGIGIGNYVLARRLHRKLVRLCLSTAAKIHRCHDLDELAATSWPCVLAGLSVAFLRVCT